MSRTVGVAVRVGIRGRSLFLLHTMVKHWFSQRVVSSQSISERLQRLSKRDCCQHKTRFAHGGASTLDDTFPFFFSVGSSRQASVSTMIHIFSAQLRSTARAYAGRHRGF